MKKILLTCLLSLFSVVNNVNAEIINFDKTENNIKPLIEKFENKKQIKIVQFGDSHTVSGYSKYVNNYLKEKNIQVLTKGKNGSRFHLLDKEQKDWIEILEKDNPDLIILNYGSNEIIYRNVNYAELKDLWKEQIEKILKVKNVPILIIETLQSEKRSNDKIVEMEKQIAKENKLLFLEDVLNYENAYGLKENKLLSKDGINLTLKGYDLVSEELAISLINLLEK